MFAVLNRLDEAEAAYSRAVEVDPDYAQAHINLGALLTHLGRPKEAEVAYRRAIEIDPDFATTHPNQNISLGEQ